MREKKKNGLRGKVFVSALAVFSLTCSNVIAKAADGSVNQIFSENVSVVDFEKTEFLSNPAELEEILVVPDLSLSEQVFEEVEFEVNENISYEFIFEDGKVSRINTKIEPNHIHTIVDGVFKIHEKNKDGSCTTTYYEGRQCTGCGLTWKGDIIQVVTQPKCQH